MEIQQGGYTSIEEVVVDEGLVFMPTVTTPITFTSNGGILQLDYSQGFVEPQLGPVIGFGSPAGVTEEIDLLDISFGPGTTETYAGGTTSGTLMVTDGTHTANLALLGQYSTANFSLSSDGHGGTIVTDPPLVGSSGHPQLAGSHA